MSSKSSISIPSLSAIVMALVFVLGISINWSPQQSTEAAAGEVLILDTSVTGGLASVEAAKVALAGGRTPIVVDAATWGGMTTADFADYDAIVVGDPTCDYDSSYAAAAIANVAVWSPAITGNIVIVGNDPVFHDAQGGNQLTESGIAYAVAQAGETGAYITLSCNYDGAPPATAVAVLAGLGVFTVTGVGCYNDSHIVVASPALAGTTDASLSNWSCSVHEGFDSFPADFLPLAIAEDPAGGPPFPGSLDFDDGTSGVPYVMVRGTDLEICGDGIDNDGDGDIDEGCVGDPVDDTPPVLDMPDDATNEATGPDGATHDFVVTATDDVDAPEDIVIVCDAISGVTVFPLGNTTITCTATDTSGNVSEEGTFVKTVVDRTAPKAECEPTTNPAGKKIPAAPGKGEQGQNQDGFYILYGSDAVGVASIVVYDDGSAFVSDPFANGDKVKVTQAPGVTPSDNRPGPGVITSHLKLKGDAILVVTDTSGNVTEAKCLVPPRPQ